MASAHNQPLTTQAEPNQRNERSDPSSGRVKVCSTIIIQFPVVTQALQCPINIPSREAVSFVNAKEQGSKIHTKEHMHNTFVQNKDADFLILCARRTACLGRLTCGASSGSHSGSILVRSRMYSRLVRTSSSYITQSGFCPKRTDDGWMDTVRPFAIALEKRSWMFRF
jgi:hypothetical protein